jgi:hypothetical protein
MPLKELNHRINQIGEQYGKDEDQNNSSGTVDRHAYPYNEESRQYDIHGAAVGERHFQLSMRKNLPA